MRTGAAKRFALLPLLRSGAAKRFALLPLQPFPLASDHLSCVALLVASSALALYSLLCFRSNLALAMLVRAGSGAISSPKM